MGWSSNVLNILWWTEGKFCHYTALGLSAARQNKDPMTKILHFEGEHDGQAKIDLSSVT